MESFFADTRYALRSLRHSPGFTIVAILTLALGIGANTAIYSVVNSVLLSPLPFRQPERLVMIWERNIPRQRDRNVVGSANYLEWLDRATSFEQLALVGWTSTNFTGDAPERVSGRKVTANFFQTLGVAPALGRTFTADEDRPRGPRVIVLSDGLWRRRFGADRQVIGHAVPIAGGSATVVGVMPASFTSMPLGDDQYWEPFGLDPADRAWTGRSNLVVGRLKSGVSVVRANAEMGAIAAGLEREHPDRLTGWSTNVIPLSEQVVGDSRRALLVLLGAVGFVLLIACANVGNLVLGRATVRAREFAVRAALGASRGRLVRQWLTESVLLACLGGVAGTVLAVWGVSLLVSAAPPQVPRLAEIAVDGRVLAVTLGVSLLAGVLFGLPAALGPSFRGAPDTLRQGTGRMTSDTATSRLRGTLTIVQMALAMVLLTGAGLMVRTLQRLASQPAGFDASHVLGVGIDVPRETYQTTAARDAFFAQLLERVRAMPGVEAAGLIDQLPLAGPGSATSLRVVGRPEPAPGRLPVADIRVADAGYFAALRIPVQRGRGFTAADAPAAPKVVLVNATMARQLWPDEDPIGQRLKINMWNPDDELTIVGVAGDVRYASLDGDVRPMAYYPRAQSPYYGGTLVMRGAGDPTALAGAVRSVVRELDRTLPLGTIATMADVMSRSVADRRFPMLLLALFSGLAVVLSAVGIYGVLSYAVSRRTREIGVRMALGARAEDVRSLVLRGGARLIGVGVLAGLAASLLTSRVLGKLLFAVSPRDPVTLAAVAALLSGVALLACWLPARRASRTDPMIALRAE